ncbi:39S mitochondrial ribosomal protein L46-domain-containing protein [Dichomitus squalens]|uniref:Large ribosomal subunit protein mL46 n=1 Tax=Dichomitus squalens TaxID=114155 RepID=A0A4Q9MN42_9APHY|nr:39S mitochondrial ribosomal protein L46-domain-containing protein [Dichomitus squalens]
MLSRNVVSACRQHTRGCLHAPSRSLASIAEASSSAASSSSATKAVINAAVIVNRSPILTRTSSLFERAYYAYQSRIRRALFNPFPTEFYFKTGSLLEKKFAREEKLREKEAFGGPWFLKRSDRGLEEDGELGSIQVSPDQADNMGEEPIEPPASRIHEADKKGDVKSLDRLGERNLYLLVRGKDDLGKEVWRFPQGPLQDGEFLHQAALRDLQAEVGENMDTWVVGKKPIAVYQPSLPKSTTNSLGGELYTFFLKAHILAGQARPSGKNVTDFAWLTKEEIEPRVEKDYWASVKDILSDH